MRKRVATKEFVRRLRGSVSQNLISDLVWTSFAPRSDLVKIAASQNPARRGFGKAAMVCCLVCCCCCCCCCLCCCFWARRGFWADKQEILSGVSGVPAMRLAQVLANGVGINVHVWISVHMVFNIRGCNFLRLWDISVHTRPDGDLEKLAVEICTARDLKITFLYSASHGVLDLVALTCLTSWMRGVPCSFYLRSTYALTFTSQCTAANYFLGFASMALAQTHLPKTG